MQWMNEDKIIYEVLSKESLSAIIELRVHPHISKICSDIHDYMLQNEQISDIGTAESEMLHIQFEKLESEIILLFKKETNVLFPCLREHPITPEVCLDDAIVGVMQYAQHKITIMLMQIRQLLNNYIHKNWSKEFIICVNYFFELENAVFRWINIEQNYLFKLNQHVKV
jgi:hypothetical protein